MNIEARRPASRARRVVIATTVAGLLLAGAPAAGAPASDGSQFGPRSLLADALEAAAPVQANVRSLRRAGDSGSVAAVLRATFAAGDQPVGALPDEGPLLDARVRDALHALPPALSEPLGDLAAAVTHAEAVVREALPVDPPAVEVAGGNLRWRDGQLFATPRMAVPDVSEVDMAAVNVAALHLAEAVDAALPRLQAAVADLPASAVSADEGCNVVDIEPLLCVGGTDDNVYTEERALVVALGGNNTHRHSAGGAAAYALPEQRPVSVTIDLDGDDLYDYTVGARDSAQGASYYGVGLLVDAAGDDTYIRRGSPQADFGLNGAHGAGAAGVGVLADLDGDDTYLVLSGDDEISYHQGLGNMGTGLLWDAAGDDRYLIEGGTADARDQARAFRGAEGQGRALGAAVGVLLDGGGQDEFVARATTVTSPVDPSQHDFLSMPNASVQAIGQGVGTLGGTAMLITGEGSTRYELSATGEGVGYHFVYGQGLSSDAGVGVVADAGGDDTFTLETVQHATAPVAADGTARADFSVLGNPQNVAGQGTSGSPGFGNIGQVGLLWNQGGNDRYRAAMVGSVTAHGADAAAWSLNAANLLAQGAAAAQGTGLLLDEAGDDAYTIEVSQTAQAQAADHGTAYAEAAQRAGPSANPPLAGQGAGGFDTTAGVLADLGGTDAYRATLRTTAVAAPTVDGAVERPGIGQFQGSGPQGALVDVDDGGFDTFAATPDFAPLCAGQRGETGVWVECADHDRVSLTAPYRPLGTGLVTSAADRADPALSIESATGAPLVVRGRLTDADGEPLAGYVVDVRLQQLAPVALLLPDFATGTRWQDLAGRSTVTDADGRWQSVLRTRDLEPSGQPLRLFAGFSGYPAHRPAIASQELAEP